MREQVTCISAKDWRSRGLSRHPGDIHSRMLLAPYLTAGLPALSTSLADLHAALNGRSVALGDVVDIISRDPSLAVQLLRLANTDAEPFSHERWELCECVVMVGARELTSLVLRLEGLGSVEKGMTEFIHVFFQHSCLAAILAESVAENIGGVDPQQAYLAGLTHDIGWLPILLQHESPRKDLLHQACCLGAWLASEWKLPIFLSAAIGAHREDAAMTRSDLQTCVVIANYFCEIFGFGIVGDAPASSEAEPFLKCALPEFNGRKRQQLMDAVERDFLRWVRSPLNVVGELPGLRNRSEVQ